MKKVLFLTRSQYGYQSDYYYYTKYLSKYYHISVVCIDSGFDKIEFDGVQVFYNKKKKYYDLVSYFYNSIFTIIKLKPDIIIVNVFPFSFLLPPLLPKKKLY